VENESLKLLMPVSEERLLGWLSEFYNKPVKISRRETLRHRDLSIVERLGIEEGLPDSLIYKLVAPPWEIEQELHERVLIPSISNSAQLYMSAHYGELTAMFMEDLGTHSLQKHGTSALAGRLGKELAKLHRAYSYRTDELVSVRVLPMIFPIDYEEFTTKLSRRLTDWNLLKSGDAEDLAMLANILASKLAGEPISLVHGDFYAENVITRKERLFFIDWSWFTILGVPVMDLATLTMTHMKNGDFTQWKDVVIDAYAFEAGRDVADLCAVLPAAEALSRVLFLHWLVERRGRNIMGTTVGPVDDLIPQVVTELRARLAKLEA